MEKDPYPERTPCLFEGCTLSVEEHHRLSRGYLQEVLNLKDRLRTKMVRQYLELSEVPTADLLAELAHRLEDK